MAASQQIITLDGFTNPIQTLPGPIPNLTAAYIYSLTDAPGVVAANNFISLFNPVGSGKKMYFLGMFISTYVAGGGSTTRNSMQGKQITAASAGTLVGAASIAKLISTYANPTSEVRISNPTVTANAAFLNSPPPIGSTASQYVHSVGLGASENSGGGFFAPGEGFVLTTAAGNTNQTWNISIVWGEGT